MESSISDGHWLESQLLHFRPSFLLMAWESTGGWHKCLGTLAHMGEWEEAPDSWLQTSAALIIAE